MLNKERVLKWIGVLVLIIGFSGCATVKPKVIVQKKEGFLLKDLCSHYGITWEWDHVAQTIDLKNKENDIRLLVGSNVMFVGDRKVLLSGPVQMKNSQVVIPRDFVQDIIIHVEVQSKEAFDYTLKKIRKVLIDAGHGGNDPGAIGIQGTQEKKIVLGIVADLKRLLEKEGLEVQLTRGEDKFLTLQERTEKSAGMDADLFISIHANSSLNPKAHGVEVYSLKNLEEKEKLEKQRKANEKLMFKRLSMKQAESPAQDILSDMLYSYKQAQSDLLAFDIVKELAQYVNIRRKGIKYAHFYVLRNTLIPAVLVEVGFLSNKKEESSLNKSVYQQKISQGIAKGILDYGKN
ncbi:MAG: N-acetylmuramoyl-L-alanine amidase [Candidatus Omnitrophica bacterium]|nr:N-acetylmuramoyl-L-alanine amidase [Candidatus Omnitrophota bacterium]